jgi:hypothetical protein
MFQMTVNSLSFSVFYGNKKYVLLDNGYNLFCKALQVDKCAEANNDKLSSSLKVKSLRKIKV